MAGALRSAQGLSIFCREETLASSPPHNTDVVCSRSASTHVRDVAQIVDASGRRAGRRMSEQLSAEVIEGAGGIVELHDSGQIRIAVIYRERYGGEWGLPKGKCKPGESWQTNALREVKEEIGLEPIITGIIGATAYLAGGTPKLVLYWRMRVDG